MKQKPQEPLFEEIPYPEYVLRILFASFYPAVKMAVEFNYPLDTVKDMMTLALWREAKRKHSTINLISLIFGKSTRTVKALSARFNKGGFFADTETNLMRRVEDLLRDVWKRRAGRDARPDKVDDLLVAHAIPHAVAREHDKLVALLERKGRDVGLREKARRKEEERRARTHTT